MPTPKEELMKAIARWEGLWQAQPQDAGNWVANPDGSRRLIGTMRGVTPATYAAWRGIRPWEVTEAMMKAITLEEAALIGARRFYEGTGLDQLPWGPATSALVDVGWGSGPRQAVLFAQRLSGANADGVVGPRTIEAYAAWVAKVGWEQATREVCRMRKAFYDLIIQRNPVWEMYRRGWYNRAEWQLPESREWWAGWASTPAPAPVVVNEPAPLPKVQEPPPALPPKQETSSGNSLAKAGTAVAGAAGVAKPIVEAWLNAATIPSIVFGVVVGVVAVLVFIHLRGESKRAKAERSVGL